MSRFVDTDADLQEQVARKTPVQHPAGYEPGVAWDGKRGNIVAATSNRAPDWDALLRAWDMDPDVVEVEEPVQMRSWDAAIGNGAVQRMYYYRANLRRKRYTGPDVSELLGHIRRVKAVAREAFTTQDAYFLGLADLQLGKKGTPQAVDRIVAGIDASAKRCKVLTRKRSIGTCYIAGLGDIGENCSGHYDMQTFEVELDGREQMRLGRRLITYAIEQHRGITERVIVPCVAGNHGEKRNANGKAFTSFADNADVEVFEQVAEAYEMAKASDVSFVIPQGSLSISLDIGGVIVGMIHGHQAQKMRGDTPATKVRNWWVNQMAGRRPTADADLLISAHFHNPWFQTIGPRANVGFPTEDSGSPWFVETYGLEAKAGMLSIVIGKSYPMGFGDWDIT